MTHLLHQRPLFPGSPYGSFLAYGVVQIAMCFLVARGTWAIIESPLLRLKRHYRYEAPAGQTGALPGGIR